MLLDNMRHLLGTLSDCCFVLLRSRPSVKTLPHRCWYIDGDTIVVLFHDNHPDRICLNGIDCPEKRLWSRCLFRNRTDTRRPQ